MITWEGNWTEADKAAAMAGIWGLGGVTMRLAELTELPLDEVFDRLFGDVTVLEAVPSVSGDIHGHVSALYPRHIKLEIGHITPALVIHELGHVLILTDKKPNIADWLSCNVIRTVSGRAVTGAGRNKYSRHMGYRATKYTGYISINYPAIQHPYYMGEDGNTPSEDFCGIWESWVKGNLADNEAGQALRQWIENYLRGRLA